MPTIEQLQEIAREKAEKYCGIKSQREKFFYEREGYYREIIRKEINEKFGTTESDACREHDLADAELRKARNERNVQKTIELLLYPEGTVLVKWEYPRYGGLKPLTQTKERGLLQVYRENDPLPDTSRWNRPHVGKIIVRPLKKDGTTGKTVRSFSPELWLPEGVDPNKK